MVGVYFVMTFFGQVAALAGPVPYDLSECMQRREEFIQKRDENFDKAMKNMNENPHTEFGGQKFTNKDQIQFYCIKSDQDHRPKLYDKFDVNNYN